MARQEEGYPAGQLACQCRTASLPRGERGFRQHAEPLYRGRQPRRIEVPEGDLSPQGEDDLYRSSLQYGQ